jgi:hypothetical protein
VGFSEKSRKQRVELGLVLLLFILGILPLGGISICKTQMNASLIDWKQNTGYLESFGRIERPKVKNSECWRWKREMGTRTWVLRISALNWLQSQEFNLLCFVDFIGTFGRESVLLVTSSLCQDYPRRRAQDFKNYGWESDHWQDGHFVCSSSHLE